MNSMNLQLCLPGRSDLARVIEPLANYICAADQPRAALASALAVLFCEVEETNRAAMAHFHTVSEHHTS